MLLLHPQRVAAAWLRSGVPLFESVEARSIKPHSLTGNELTWEAKADLESGISHFIIQCDGKVVATVPEQPKNPFGRPLFQGLQYSDTPAAP